MIKIVVKSTSSHRDIYIYIYISELKSFTAFNVQVIEFIIKTPKPSFAVLTTILTLQLNCR